MQNLQNYVPKFCKTICKIEKKFFVFYIYQVIITLQIKEKTYLPVAVRFPNYAFNEHIYICLVFTTVITTAQLHSMKLELRFWAGSNHAYGELEICDGEDLTKVPAGNKAKCLLTDKNLKTSLFWVMRKKEAFACTILGKICYVVETIIHIGKLICLCAILRRHCMSLKDKPAIFHHQTVFTSQNIKQCVCFKPLFKYMMTSSTLSSISFCYEFSNTDSREKWGRGKYKNLNILGNEKSFLWNREHIS